MANSWRTLQVIGWQHAQLMIMYDEALAATAILASLKNSNAEDVNRCASSSLIRTGRGLVELSIQVRQSSENGSGNMYSASTPAAVQE